MTDRLRLFIAVSVPEQLLQIVERETDGLRARFTEGRWTPRSNQHVTLKFLGSTDETLLPELRALCDEVAHRHAAATVTLAGAGSFPSGRRMRVLWAGLEDPGGLLTNVAADLDDALASLGFEVESRSFTPHLTLARFRTPLRLDAPLEPFGTFGSFDVRSFELWRSHLSPKGARYQELDSFDLRG